MSGAIKYMVCNTGIWILILLSGQSLGRTRASARGLSLGGKSVEKGDPMGLSKWAKQARELANQHSGAINSGIDRAASAAKSHQPNKSSSIDKAAQYAKKAVNKT